MMLINELSGDRAFEHIRAISRWHRDSGMDGYFKAADYVIAEAKKAGLEDVTFVEQDLGRPNYTAISADLWITSPISYKLADIGDHALFLADGSHSANIENAELVFVGDGSKEALRGIDVKGKIVLTNGNPVYAVYNAVWENGALGVISYSSSESKQAFDFPDQIAWTRIPSDPPKGKNGTFAFNLSPRSGEALREMLESSSTRDFMRSGERAKGGKLTVSAKVKTKFEKKNRTGFVEAWIRGTEHKDQQIVLTAHLQEEQGSANDDGSGVGNMLEIGRTLVKLINEGKIERPKRDIRFWWTDEISSEYQYFSDFPDESKKMLANLHQDMTGAKQSLGSRTQSLIFAPHSITTYLDAIFESVCMYVINTNNAFITAGRMGGYPRPHSVEIYSKRGTRESFGARFVPFFNASDNMNFVEGYVGVPAVGLINWDDNYIHSSDDDLWQIDQTQLKRNAFIIASMAYYLGKATKNDVPLLLAETRAQGAKRLANDLQRALVEIQTLEDKVEAFKNAHILIEQGVLREQRALNSIRVFSATKEATFIVDYLTQLEADKVNLLENIRLAYKVKYNETVPSAIALNKAEQEAQRKVPRNNPNNKDYLANRGKARVNSNIHSTMRFELFNFVDGKRSYYEIYKALKAESLAASRFYYGEVSLEDVVRILDKAVETKALILN